MGKYDAQEKYDRENTIRVTFKLNKKTEADIIEALESADKKQTFIKEAIRNYIGKELARADKWIPCSERLPEEYGHYLVTATHEGELIVISDDYYSYGWDDFGDSVIAWKELPKPYKSGE